MIKGGFNQGVTVKQQETVLVEGHFTGFVLGIADNAKGHAGSVKVARLARDTVAEYGRRAGGTGIGKDVLLPINDAIQHGRVLADRQKSLEVAVEDLQIDIGCLLMELF